MSLREIYKWYYDPGQVLKSIGFYINPFQQWENAPHRHIFAFDAECNLYVGQFSVYPDHMSKVCDLTDRREYGILYPKNSNMKPKYSDTTVTNSLNDYYPVIDLHFVESKNIIYLNRRLRKLAQRLYDYGMPPESVFVSKEVDLWQPSLAAIVKNKFLNRPTKEWLEKQIREKES